MRKHWIILALLAVIVYLLIDIATINKLCTGDGFIIVNPTPTLQCDYKTNKDYNCGYPTPRIGTPASANNP